LFVDEFCDVDYVGVDIMAAVLFLEKAGGTGKPFGALRMFAKVFDSLGGMLGTTHLMV
jgi:hypothetical protein